MSRIWTPSRRLQRGFFTLPGGMGSAFPPGGGDPNFANVQLLLHMEGADGSTTFTDSSSSPKTVTANGNAQIDTAQSKFGSSSCLLDGSGDYLGLPNAASVVPESGNFTVEAFVRMASFSGNNTLYGTGDAQISSGFLFTVNSSGLLQVFGTNANIVAPAGSVSLSTWTHIALTRSGSTWRTFAGGVLAASGTNSNNYAANSTVYIGARNYAGSTGDYFNGHIDEFRFTKGVARYTSNFTPPAAPFPDF